MMPFSFSTIHIQIFKKFRYFANSLFLMYYGFNNNREKKEKKSIYSEGKEICFNKKKKK